MSVTKQHETPKQADSDAKKQPLPAKLLTTLTVVAATAISGGLIFTHLGRRGLANDEATSYFIAHLDWGRLWESLVTSEANGGIFYVALHYWLDLSRSEVALRTLPAIFAVATVPIAFLVVRRLFGTECAAVTAVLLALNSWFLSLGGDLRSYSLSAFLVVVSTFFFVRAVQERSSWNWAAYSIAGALSVYAHFFGALALAAHLISLLSLGFSRIQLKRVLLAYAAILVLILPLIYFILFQDKGQVDWIPEPTIGGLWDAAHDLSGMPDSNLAVVAYLVPVGLLAVYSIAAVVRRQFGEEAWRHALIVLWAVLPVASAYAISLFKPLFVSRYLSVGLPALAACVPIAAFKLRRPLAYAAALVAVILALSGTLADFTATRKSAWEARTSLVAERATAGDATLFYSPTVIRPFGYYSGFYRNTSPTAPPPIYPSLYWLGYSATRFNPNLEAIGARIAQHERVWFVTDYAFDEPRGAELTEIENLLLDSCRPARHFFRGHVRLYTNCGRNDTAWHRTARLRRARNPDSIMRERDFDSITPGAG